MLPDWPDCFIQPLSWHVSRRLPIDLLIGMVLLAVSVCDLLLAALSRAELTRSASSGSFASPRLCRVWQGGAGHDLMKVMEADPSWVVGSFADVPLRCNHKMAVQSK